MSRAKPQASRIRRVPIKLVSPAKCSPKLIDFSRWSLIDEVHAKLDEGITPHALVQWVKDNGYNISLPLLYDYARLRQQALVHGVSMAHILGVTGKPMFDLTSPAIKTSKDKLKSEIDALDTVIQRGYETLTKNPEEPIHPALMMTAIKLKNELTDGNHGFLTNYGMEHLRDIETAKYNLIIEHLISYIPEDKKSEAVSKIRIIEDNYYQTTDYYEEYLRAAGDLSEVDIQKKLDVWKERRNSAIQTVI